MKILKEIFARIWALWGLICFVVTILIAFIFYSPCFFMKEPAAGKYHRVVSRVWMVVFLIKRTCWGKFSQGVFGLLEGGYLHLIACPFKVKGREYFQPGKNYVIT